MNIFEFKMFEICLFMFFIAITYLVAYRAGKQEGYGEGLLTAIEALKRTQEFLGDEDNGN